MNKRKNILLFLITIISIISITLFAKYETNKELKGADKKIYNIFKADEIAVSNNFESINDTTEISVMSYNIHRGKDYKGKYTLEEIMNLLKESNVDIICLQEVLFSHHTLIMGSGNYKSQYVANIDIPIASTGVATYSKYPIIESNHIILSSKTEQRGALHTVYRINNKIVNVINVHLGLDKKERLKQIDELLDYCNGLKGEIILAGDFNQKSLEVDGFIDVGKYHGYRENDTFFPTNARIDYIFMTDNYMYSTTYSILNTKLSDHYPITTKIKYKPEKIEVDEENDILESIWLKLSGNLKK